MSRLNSHFGAFEHVAALLEADIAPRVDFILGLVVAQPVRVDRFAALAQAHRALGLDFPVVMALDIVGVDKQRHRILVVRRDADKRRLGLKLKPARAGLEADRGVVRGAGTAAGARQQQRNRFDAQSSHYRYGWEGVIKSHNFPN